IVVIGLPTVGVVMMAALLIIPGVTARFWTDRLSRLVVLAAGVGAGMGLIGTALSANYSKMPAGPIITLVGTGLVLASALVAARAARAGARVAARPLASRLRRGAAPPLRVRRVRHAGTNPRSKILVRASSAEAARGRRAGG